MVYTHNQQPYGCIPTDYSRAVASDSKPMQPVDGWQLFVALALRHTPARRPLQACQRSSIPNSSDWRPCNAWIFSPISQALLRLCAFRASQLQTPERLASRIWRTGGSRSRCG